MNIFYILRIGSRMTVLNFSGAHLLASLRYLLHFCICLILFCNIPYCPSLVRDLEHLIALISLYVHLFDLQFSSAPTSYEMRPSEFSICNRISAVRKHFSGTAQLSSCCPSRHQMCTRVSALDLLHTKKPEYLLA